MEKGEGLKAGYSFAKVTETFCHSSSINFYLLRSNNSVPEAIQTCAVFS